MDIQFQLLVCVVVIPQVILWLLVALVLVYKFLLINRGDIIKDEECPEPAIELEDPPFTPFGGRAVGAAPGNHMEEVFSVSRTLGASQFAMEDVLALSTTRIRSAMGTIGMTMSKHGCSMLEDVLAMRTIEIIESSNCILMTSGKEDSSSLYSLDNARSSGEDVFESDANDSCPSVFHSSSSSSSSPQSPQAATRAANRARMTSTPRCPQQLLRDALASVTEGRSSVRKVFLKNMPSKIEISEAMPSAINNSCMPQNSMFTTNKYTLDAATKVMELNPINTLPATSNFTSSLQRGAIDLLSTNAWSTFSALLRTKYASSTYQKFDDSDDYLEIDIIDKPEFLRVQRF